MSDVTPAEETARGYRSNLPHPVSELIGRDAAVQQLRSLISVCRILTLSGPGGIGKTLLALHVVESVCNSFGGDTLLVDLAAISDPNLVCSAVANALDLKLGAREIDPASIAIAIGDTKLLFLLENCEYVVDLATIPVETIVRARPGVSVLATSRELMRIDGEVVNQVSALNFLSHGSGRDHGHGRRRETRHQRLRGFRRFDKGLRYHQL
jgi:non-specific serine/threonine protein kinase